MTKLPLLTFAALLLASFIGPASAGTPYDGSWSVLIVTQEGNCDAAYRYPLRIADGKVLYDGQNDFAVSGNVSGGGTVNVSISRGESKANGSGRLTSSGGTGKWTGKSSNTTCSGRWEAERRS